MKRRMVLTSIAAGSAAALGATTMAGATRTDFDDTAGAPYVVTDDGSGGRVRQRAATGAMDVSTNEDCIVEDCCDCPPGCRICACIDPCDW